MFDVVYQIDAASKLNESSGGGFRSLRFRRGHLKRLKYCFEMNGLGLR